MTSNTTTMNNIDKSVNLKSVTIDNEIYYQISRQDLKWAKDYVCMGGGGWRPHSLGDLFAAQENHCKF